LIGEAIDLESPAALNDKDPTSKIPENDSLPPAVSLDPEPHEPDFATLSQWQLIGRRFARHKLAVVSGMVLVLLYLLALFAEFFSPYPNHWRDSNFAYAPPMLPQVSLEHGLHTGALKLEIDPVSLKRTYILLTDRVVPLGFFVRGEPYRLMGLLPSDIHFFGVDRSRLAAKGWGAEDDLAVVMLAGGDQFGRDLFSRLIYGSRVSLSIGLVAIFATFLLGCLLGGISGYVGGRTDLAIQRLIEIINGLPTLPLWLALGAAVPADWPPLRVYFVITIVLSLLSWTGLGRVVRGKILSLREEDYATAARLLGASHGRILFRHLLPGFTSHIIVSLTLSIPWMILGETALSFLGLGLRPPIVSWGVLLQDAMNMQAVAQYPWLLMPLLFILSTVLAFNFLGDGLRDAADPYASH
jgi:peptide/nickel transport system permease protein